MEVQLYGAEMVTTSQRWQFHTRLNWARHAATIWLDADWPRVIERLKRKIHQVTPAKCKRFDKSFQHHEQQILQEVRTKATSLRSIFAKTPSQKKTAADDEAYRVVNMSPDRRMQFQVCLSDAEIEFTTCSIADTDPVVNQVERDISRITSMTRCSSQRNSPSASSSVKLGWRQSAFRCFRKPSNSVSSVLGIQWCILWAVYQSQLGEWIAATIPLPIFLNGYILAMWTRHIDLPTMSMTFNRCSNTMTCLPVLPIWRRHCHILPFKAGTILTVREFSTYRQLPRKSEIHAKPIFYATTIVRKCHFSAPYHNRNIMWSKLMSAACAEVSN